MFSTLIMRTNSHNVTQKPTIEIVTSFVPLPCAKIDSLRRLGCIHSCAEAGFGVGGPVFAVEADEDGGVGDGEVGF